MLKKLRVQIALYYLTASVLTLLLMGFILYYSISSIVLRDALKNTEVAVDRSGNYLELYIDRLKAVSSLLAENPTLVTYFSTPQNSKEIESSILTMIKTTTASDAFIKSVILVSKDGRVLSNESGLDMSMSSDMMKEAWYVSAIHSGSMPVLTSARMQKFSMDKENWVISISRELTNTQGENIGVLLIDIEYQVIEDYLSNLDLGKTGFAFILNDSAEVVYHKDPTYFENSKKQAQLSALLHRSPVYAVSENTLLHIYPLKNADWTLVGVASLDELALIKSQLMEIFILVGILLLIVAASSVLLFAKKITAPIQALERAMQDVELGLKEVAIDEKGCYEAQSLAQHFNVMVRKMQKLLLEISDKEKNLRTYEISALHSQINPHFLYNTLDTIVWMAEFNDSEKVIDTTKALAQFFRLSLSGGSEMTTVGNELDHVRQYLFIQKARYGDKLTYTITCTQEEMLSLKMPKILLQPLVENALYHGIRDLDRPGYVHIQAHMDSTDMTFTVEDNGIGFVPAPPTITSPDKKIKLDGVGLKNVDQRIKLYYGDQYGLTIASVLSEGTVITVRIGLMA